MGVIADRLRVEGGGGGVSPTPLPTGRRPAPTPPPPPERVAESNRIVAAMVAAFLAEATPAVEAAERDRDERGSRDDAGVPPRSG